MEVAAPDRRELQQALAAWLVALKRDEAVASAHLYEDLETPTAFCVVAIWSAREALDAHVAGPTFGAVLGALDVLGAQADAELAEVGGPSSSPRAAVLRLKRDVGTSRRDRCHDGPGSGVS
jgi:quinol monooxygenase YgiN